MELFSPMVGVMDAREILFLNAFNAIPGVGPVTLRALVRHFGSYENAWRADAASFNNAPFDPSALRAICAHKSSYDPEREMKKVEHQDLWIITEDHAAYPLLLKQIGVPPVILYGRGAQFSNSRTALAVVGTRRPTPYGKEATSVLVRGLVDAGITIVSGLATGIDTHAHAATLDAGGTTIAVIGSGLDPYSIFPPQNVHLAERIATSGGMVISEYAPETPAIKEHFPLRNRIISGLSQGVLVIEAREKSGALITARYALEQNRDVFAIPGSLFSPTSAGPNKLIQEGAKLATSAQDILEELGIEYTYTQRVSKDSADILRGEKNALILTLLCEQSLTVGDLKQKTGLETSAIMATLSFLELKGLVKNMGGDTYQRI